MRARACPNADFGGGIKPEGREGGKEGVNVAEEIILMRRKRRRNSEATIFSAAKQHGRKVVLTFHVIWEKNCGVIPSRVRLEKLALIFRCCFGLAEGRVRAGRRRPGRKAASGGRQVAAAVLRQL